MVEKMCAFKRLKESIEHYFSSRIESRCAFQFESHGFRETIDSEHRKIGNVLLVFCEMFIFNIKRVSLELDEKNHYISMLLKTQHFSDYK